MQETAVTPTPTPPVRGPGRPVSGPKVPTDAVKLARKEKGWNQEELAQHLKCSLSAVRYAERHRQLFGQRALRDAFTKFAAEVGTPLDAIDPEREG